MPPGQAPRRVATAWITLKTFMNHRQQLQQLSKLLTTILARRPDEFGLIPDDEGFVTIKELLRALGETDGWRHIRRSHINELMLAETAPPVEVRDNRIRAADRRNLPAPRSCEDPPRLLYTAIRKKAYPAVLQKGLRPAAGKFVVCAAQRETAERLGRRKDNDPVVLTVHTVKTAGLGIAFYRFGQEIYLAEFIPAETVSGPPMPKAPEPPAHAEKSEKTKTDDYHRQAKAGSYTITAQDLAPPPAQGKNRGKGKKKQLSWKQERRQRRRR